ncbi:MAG: hypothetical protein JNM39_02500 [Bdellovibrionaceae bacterium]|nr:hypothetical protein [Pseudobdellovibrionaceae bacterium]
MKLGIVLGFGVLFVSVVSIGNTPQQCCRLEGTSGGPGEWSIDRLGFKKCVPAGAGSPCFSSQIEDDGETGKPCTKDGKQGKLWYSDEEGVMKCDIGETPAQSATPPTAKGCVSEEEKEACTQAATEAASGCSLEDDIGFKNADAALYQIAHGLAAKVRSDDTPGGTNAACGTLGKATTGLNAAMAAFGTSCSSKRDACLQGCKSVKYRELACLDNVTKKPQHATNDFDLKQRQSAREAIIQEYDEKIFSCQKLDSKIGQARQALSDSIQSAKQMTTCKDETESPGSDEYCKLRPNDLGCQAKLAQDCSNPSYAAANGICACFGANQNSDACRLAQKAISGDSIASGGLGIGGAGAGGKTSRLNLDDENGPASDLKLPGVAYGEDPGGAKGGQGAPGNSGGNPLGGSGGGRGGGGLPPEEKPGGFISGNPAGGSGGGFLGGISSAVKQLLGGDEKKEKPLSLDKFRPDFKKPLISMRGLAGATGPDGITGPNSDIWLKVKKQYHLQLFTFILTP